MRWLLAMAMLCGCGVPGDGPGGDDPTVEPDPTPPVFDQGPPISARGDLRMKRWRQLALDLEGALELSSGDLCNETGNFPCADLHAVPLGGISIDNGLFEPLDQPSATTGLAIERFVLQACWHRFQKDQEGPPVVFQGIDPDGTTVVDPDRQVRSLYRRLLARDPLDEELAAMAGLHAQIIDAGGLNGEWQVLSCFTIATSSEALLY
jgi:hypothetical protein